MPPKFETVRSRALSLPAENVDTDQITPARFLRGTRRDRMGEVLFADWREDPDFVLNQEGAREAQILVAGDNFGCGSSREHAPWALYDWGFRAIVSSSFADIFKSNAMKNGIVPVEVPEAVLEGLFEALAADRDAELVVDLEAQTLTTPEGEAIAFTIDGFSRDCLLAGEDELDYLRGFSDAVAAFERARGDGAPATTTTTRTNDV